MKIEITRSLPNAANLRKQHGASLLEGIAYLGIAALVVLGAVSLLTSASTSAQANKTKEELVAMRTAIKKIYAGQAYPASGTFTDILIKAMAVPSTLQTTSTTITNSWGGAVTLNGASTTEFTIVYSNIPTDVCINALSGLSGWSGIKRGSGTSVGSKGAIVTTTDASNVCNSNTGSNDVSFSSN